MKGILKIGPKKFEIKIVKFTIELKKEGIEYALRDQLLHSGTSVRADEEKLKQAVR